MSSDETEVENLNDSEEEMKDSNETGYRIRLKKSSIRSQHFVPRRSKRISFNPVVKKIIFNEKNDPQVYPCSVLLYRLSPKFIKSAIEGRVKWKRMNKYVLDLESYHKDSIIPEIPPQIEYFDCANDVQETVGDTHEDIILDIPLRSHRKRKSKNVSVRDIPDFNCSECSFVAVDIEELDDHSLIHKLECTSCDIRFNNRFEYQRHTYETHEPPVELVRNIIYGCKLCRQVFDHETLIKNHFNVHMDASADGKYACPLCKSTFAKEISLINHLSTKHITYKCTFCDYLVTNYEALERHSFNSHAAYGKPFLCNLCNYRCASFVSLVVHKKSNHGIEWSNGEEKCIICGEQVQENNESTLEHLITHIEGNLFECILCCFVSNSFQSIRQHGVERHEISEITKFTRMMDSSVMTEKITNLTNKIGKIGVKLKPFKREKFETEPHVSSLVNESINESNNISEQVVLDTPRFNPDFSLVTPFSCNGEMQIAPAMPLINFSSPLEPTVVQRMDSVDKFSPEDKMKSSVTPLNWIVDSSIPSPSYTIVNNCSMDIPGVLTVDPFSQQLLLEGLPVVDERGNTVHLNSNYHSDGDLIDQQQILDQQRDIMHHQNIIAQHNFINQHNLINPQQSLITQPMNICNDQGFLISFLSNQGI